MKEFVIVCSDCGYEWVGVFAMEHGEPIALYGIDEQCVECQSLHVEPVGLPL